MNAEIQDINDLQRAVVEVIRAYPVNSLDERYRRSEAIIALWRAFHKGAKDETDRIRRQLQMQALNIIPWYLGPNSEDSVEFNFSRAAAVKDEEAAEVQAAADARAEGAAYVEQVQRTDALARLPTKERQAVARDQKLSSALRRGAVPMERGAAHLFWSTGNYNDRVRVNLVQGLVDYRVLQTLAVCARCLIEDRGRQVLATPAEPMFSSAEDLESVGMAIQQMEEIERPKYAPCIAFTDSDFRRILGKPKLSSQKIFNIVNYFATIVADFTDFPGLNVKEPDGSERWVKNSNLRASLVFIRSDVKVDRRQPPAHKGQETLYQVYFISPFSLAFLENMSRNSFMLMPQRLFSLSPRAQELFIAMKWRSGKEFKLSSLAALFGWTRMDIRARHYRRAVRRVLDELKGADFVRDWTERENRDGETVYAVRIEKKFLAAKIK